MKQLITFILTVGLLGALTGFANPTNHDFYTSMTKVDYNIASSTVQFSTKIDVEHIEKALDVNQSQTDFESKLQQYIAKHINVKINDTAYSIEYARYKITGEVVWVYYNISNISQINSMEVKNTLLFEKYPEQKNFVYFNINGKRDSMIAQKGKSTAKKSF